jgi:hypothetical protein
MFYYNLALLIIIIYPLFCLRINPSSSFHHLTFVNSEKTRKTYSFFITILLIILAGFRGVTVGRDTDQYSEIFDSIKNHSLSYCLKESSVEYGYTIFQYLVVNLGGNYQMFLLLTAILTLCPVGYIIYKYSKHPWISFLIFISFPVFTTLAFSALRQGIAMGFILFAFHYSQKHQLYRYLICIIFAYFFHATALIFLPVYWISKIKLTNKVIFISIVLMVIGYLLKEVLFAYLNSQARIAYEVEDAGGNNMYLFFVAVVLFSFIYRKYATDKYSSNAIYLYMIILSVIIWPLCSANPGLFRLTFYFNFFLALYVSNFIYSLRNKITKKVAILLFVVVSFYSIGYIVMRPELINYPYFFYWENDSSKWDKLDNF